MSSPTEPTQTPTTEPTLGINYFYESPSAWPFVIFWALCPLLAAATWAISWNNIIGHRKSAQRAGFGQNTKIWSWYSSFGVRVDLTTDLLVLPMVYSLTGCLDVFRPELADFTIFIRTVWLSKALVRTVKLFFIRSGGWKPLWAGLDEQGPMKPKAPPCCCIFAWPCCARKVQFDLAPHPWSIAALRYGIYQFTIFGPMFAILNIVLKSQAIVTGGADRRIQYTTVASSIYTTLSLYCYRVMADYFAPVIEKICLAKGDDTFNPGEGKFVVLHYLFASLTNLVLNLAVQDGHDNGNWVMHRTTLATMINGFATCIVELLLAVMAMKLFPHNETSYPPLECESCKIHKGLPLDTVPLLQMYGVATSEWEIFQANRRITTVGLEEPSPASHRPTKPQQAAPYGDAVEPEVELVGRSEESRARDCTGQELVGPSEESRARDCTGQQAAAAKRAAAKAGEALSSGDASEIANAANLLGFLGPQFTSESLKAKLESLRTHENKEVQSAVASALSEDGANRGEVTIHVEASI